MRLTGWLCDQPVIFFMIDSPLEILDISRGVAANIY